MESIFHRVSIRRFQDRPVEREKTEVQGLGGVWLGIAPLEDRMKAVEKVLDIPDHLRTFVLFPYGYPAEERKQQNRYDESRIHYVD